MFSYLVSVVQNLKRRIVFWGGVNFLIKRGLKLGNNFQYEKGLLIDKIYPFLIEIGDDVIFSANVSVLAHDAGLKNQMGLVRIGRVKIGNRCFVGLGTIILPGVNIGDDVIIGAGSVVTKDIPSRSVCAGVPARVICTIDSYKNRIINLSKEVPVLPNELDLWNSESGRKISEIISKVGLKKAVNYNSFKSID